MLSGYSFRPRAWHWLLAGCACAGAVALGNWQASRAEAKRVLGAQLEQTLKAPAVELKPGVVFSEVAARRVFARGVFIASHTVLLDNKIHQGRVGYEVI